MSEEPEKEKTVLGQYITWLFEGNILFIIIKFLWTGWYVTAFTTFQFIEGVIILAVGGIVWFVYHDWQNWEIQWDDQTQ